MNHGFSVAGWPRIACGRPMCSSSFCRSRLREELKPPFRILPADLRAVEMCGSRTNWRDQR
jgi:hypothetical protein